MKVQRNCLQITLYSDHNDVSTDLEKLADNNTGLNDTQIIEAALAIAVQVQEAWNGSYHLIAKGPFDLADSAQAVTLNHCIWGDED